MLIWFAEDILLHSAGKNKWKRKMEGLHNSETGIPGISHLLAAVQKYLQQKKLELN